ncbi:MAG TPA: response regulator [Chitinophagaceae bacterium]
MNQDPQILMLEDDPDDRFITEHTIKELDLDIKITFVQNSKDLFDYLEQNPAPTLILMDYNSAPENAIQIIGKIKSENSYRSIPLIVLGESTSSKFVSECYSKGANSFIQKPSTLAGTREKIKSFFNYWLSTAEIY